MIIDPKDIRIDVGIKAYELFTGEKINYKHIQVYPDKEEYRFGVYIYHVPTGKKIYCNTERSQIKNRDKALKDLEDQIINKEVD